MGSETLELPKIDFSGLEPGTTAEWDAVQGQVLRALESYGCFEAIYDKVTPELRDALFVRELPELFGLPLHIKNNNPNLLVEGYIRQLPGLAYESLLVQGDDAEKFTHQMWPQGNPSFYDTICNYTKHLKDLNQIIERMIFRSLGVEKYLESHIESTTYALRMSEYWVPSDPETNVSMEPHLDPNMVTIICQNLVEGLEVQTKEGEWIHVVPLPNSFTVLIGEAFEAWSNGRLQSPLHHVRMINKGKRYSSILYSQPKYGSVIQAPKELVDEEHPVLYKPYNYSDHLKFRFSDGGARVHKTLKDYFGATGEEVQA